MSGNVLEERYRVMSLQGESLRHLKNTITLWRPDSSWDTSAKATVLTKIEEAQAANLEFGKFYVTHQMDDQAVDLSTLLAFRERLLETAGIVIENILIPAWQRETDSLILFGSKKDDQREDESAKEGVETHLVLSTDRLAPHVRVSEEFVVLPYLAFIQNILGRLRTMALGSLWLFVGTTLAISSYPFQPLNVLGGIFLAAFVTQGAITVLIYSQMARDVTLSHITNTSPGKLGLEFWERVVAFGIGPLIGLLTTLFPSITDFVFSWLQPGAQALK
jgi:hypothetical protein